MEQDKEVQEEDLDQVEWEQVVLDQVVLEAMELGLEDLVQVAKGHIEITNLTTFTFNCLS